MTPTRLRIALCTLAALALTACDVPGRAPEEGQFLERLPEGLAEAAAPGQNMARVIIAPEDGCYWYEHVGPVETTFLPLRTPRGNPLCSR